MNLFARIILASLARVGPLVLLALLVDTLSAAPIPPSPAVVAPVDTYHVGNSLTWDLKVADGLPAISQAAGVDHTTGYHIRSARSLTYIWNNPTDFTNKSPDTWNPSLSGQVWNALTLQPHPYLGATIADERQALLDFMNFAGGQPGAENTRFFLYATWPKTDLFTPGTFADYWNANVTVTLADPFVQRAAVYDLLYDELAADPTYGDRVFLVSAGDVLADLESQMLAGTFAGFDDIEDLYRDTTHMNNVGRFVASTTMMAALFNKDPRGLAVPLPEFGIGQTGGTNNVPITAPMALTIQETSWRVLNSDLRTGVTPEPSTLGLILLAAILASGRRAGRAMARTGREALR